MLDITGIVDLISTAVQGGVGFAVKGLSGKGKANGAQKAFYDNTIEIGRDISPAFGEVLNEFFYGKGMSRDTLRGKITKALADINENESDIADKLNKFENQLSKFSSSSYTVQRSAADNIRKMGEEKVKLEKNKTKIEKAGNLAKGAFDDLTTRLYENKNVQDIAEGIEQTVKDYNERIKDEK